MKTKLLNVFFCAVLLSVAVMTGCAPNQSNEGKPVLMVSIEPLRYFVEHIAGDAYRVESIVPRAYNPESYRPMPQQLMALSSCQAYFKVGALGFETTWLAHACQDQPQLKVIDTSDSLRTTASGLPLATFDPHTWTSPSHAAKICATVCEALCRMDSARAPEFRANLQKELAAIDSTDAQLHALLADVPCRAFITVHPSLTYFAREYGLRQFCIERDGKEPSPEDLRQLVRQSKEEGVRVIFLLPQFAREQAAVIARETGAKMVEVNPLGYDWHAEMLRLARALKADFHE